MGSRQAPGGLRASGSQQGCLVGYLEKKCKYQKHVYVYMYVYIYMYEMHVHANGPEPLQIPDYFERSLCDPMPPSQVLILGCDAACLAKVSFKRRLSRRSIEAL